jgi:ABC-type branched-subunit amino acid transport system ATPase component/ABC-type branched-subunit amino acid transport system permease subunit
MSAVACPFIVLFVVLIVTPRGRLVGRRFVPSLQLAKPYTAPARVRLVFGVVAVALLWMVPMWVGPKLGVYSVAVSDAILFLSLGLLVKVGGQVSLCQYGFAAVGAAAMGHYVGGFGVPWLLGLLLAGLTAVPVGALIAIPAIRLSGVFLALATLGFGLLLEQMFYPMNLLFGSTASGLAVPRPHATVFGLDLSSDRGMYYVVLVLAVLTALASVLITRSRLGRLLTAMGDAPVALETVGVSTNVSRVLIFAISAFFAAISGALTASLLNFGIGSEFQSFASLTLVALVVIVPIGAPWYALVAAAGLAVLPSYLNVHNISDYLAILFGLSAALAPITLVRHPGVPQRLRRVIDGLDARVPHLRPVRAGSAAGLEPWPDHHVDRARPPTQQRTGLAVRDLRVAYGGAVAVDGVSLTAPTGAITGLIGPNGAGKTTTFNAVCGLLAPREGSVWLHGSDVSRLGPAGRARRGLGRTFQRVELFDSLMVSENIALGREGPMAGANPVTQLLGGRRALARVRAAVEEAADLAGIQHLLSRRIGELTTGQRRLVELARVLAGPFDMILLDEPSSGLDRRETEAFGAVLRSVVSQRGAGILIVEHDMSLIRQICDQVWVLDFGHVIFEGAPSEMLDSDSVRAAYLGSDVVAPGV